MRLHTLSRTILLACAIIFPSACALDATGLDTAEEATGATAQASSSSCTYKITWTKVHVIDVSGWRDTCAWCAADVKASGSYLGEGGEYNYRSWAGDIEEGGTETVSLVLGTVAISGTETVRIGHTAYDTDLDGVLFESYDTESVACSMGSFTRTYTTNVSGYSKISQTFAFAKM